MIEVCKAQLRDMPHIVRLDVQTQEFALDVEGAKKWFISMETPPYVARYPFLARLGGREVGFALSVFDKLRGAMVIDRVGVHPKFRRVGIGRKIIERVVLESVTIESDKVQMIVPSYIVDDTQDPWNIEQWLWKLGFKATVTVSDHYRRYNRDYDGYIFQRMNP